MELFDRFLQERTYCKGVSSDTLASYRNVRRAFQTILAEPTKQGMLESIQGLLAGGVSPIGRTSGRHTIEDAKKFVK